MSSEWIPSHSLEAALAVSNLHANYIRRIIEPALNYEPLSLKQLVKKENLF